MMDAEPVARLREFGLSDYGARVYLSLLELGATDARQASRVARVPLSKIYHVLDQLQERGLVRVLPETPKRYEPVPFESYVDRLREEHLRNAAALEREREDLGALFRIRGMARAGDHGGLTVIRGRRNVLDKLADMARGAQEDLLVVATQGTLARRRRIEHDLQEAMRRGVRVRLLVPREEAHAAWPGVDARVRPAGDKRGEGVCFVVADARRACLVDHVSDDASLLTGKDVGVIVTQEGLVAGLRGMLDALWQSASPLEAAPPQASAMMPPA